MLVDLAPTYQEVELIREASTDDAAAFDEPERFLLDLWLPSLLPRMRCWVCPGNMQLCVLV